MCSLSKSSGSRVYHPGQEDATNEAAGKGHHASWADIYIHPHEPASTIEDRAGWSVFTAAEKDWTSVPWDIHHWLELCVFAPNVVAKRLWNGLAA